MLGLGLGLTNTFTLGTGARPWSRFGGLAFRIGGLVLRIGGQAIVMENPND